MHSSLTAKDESDLSPHEQSTPEFGSSWEAHGFGDQILRHQDGSTFNLSSIDWESVNVYYEYDTLNTTRENEEVMSPGRAVVLVLFALMFVAGLVGNVFVVYTVIRHATMRRVKYLYLMNLSGANILYLVVCLPALSANYALVDWRFGRAFCKVENYIMSVSMAVSALTILAIGVDCYLAFLNPESYRTLRTVKKTVVLILMVWMTSFATMTSRVPMFEEISVFHKTGPITLCSREASRTMLKIDTVLMFIFVYIFPLLINCACSYQVSCKSKNNINQSINNINQSVNNINQSGNNINQSGKIIDWTRRRTTNIILSIAIVFGIGWFPVHFYHLIEDFDNRSVFLGEFIDRGTVVLLFSFGANSLNPIVVVLSSTSFRNHFKAALRFICCKCLASNIENTLESGNAIGNEEKEHKYSRTSALIYESKPELSESLLQVNGIPREISIQGDP